LLFKTKTPYTLSKQELVSERKNNILNQQSILNHFLFPQNIITHIHIRLDILHPQVLAPVIKKIDLKKKISLTYFVNLAQKTFFIQGN
jgi:hypothetical protein